MRFVARAILLDIEGTVSSIAFVRDIMFPFVRRNLSTFLDAHSSREEVVKVCRQILTEWGQDPPSPLASVSLTSEHRQAIEKAVNGMMDQDRKATGLKALQGLIWQAGFDSGELQAELFDDVLPKLLDWQRTGLRLFVYSSGSIAAQRLFFGHTTQGDLRKLFLGYFDTTSGNKKSPESYHNIARQIGEDPRDILFISDIADELLAAQSAGVQVVGSLRPGNSPFDADAPFPVVTTFEDIEVALR